MEELDDFESINLPAADSRIRQFYDKISEIPSKQWRPLENKNYKLTQFGQLEIKDISQFNDWPQLHYFHYA